MPVEDAFAWMVEREPELEWFRLDAESRSGIGGQSGPGGPAKTPKKQLSTMVGPISSHADPLLRSQLALSVASQYLAILANEREMGSKADVQMSYFKAPAKVHVRTGVLCGRRQSET
jgi:hypothetical protein